MRIYQQPKIKLHKLKSSSIICASTDEPIQNKVNQTNLDDWTTQDVSSSMED